MRYFKYTFYLLVVSFISCSTKKDVIYIQDVNQNQNFVSEFDQYKIKVDDILKITITVQETPESNSIFPTAIEATPSQSSNNLSAIKYNGYQVDYNGFITYPALGKIFVLDKTLDNLKELIKNKIIDDGVLLNPFIDIKLINSSFTVLGEVNQPGNFEYLKNNLNLLEAIGMAGDLTINANRKDLRIIRQKESNDNINTNFVIKIDLTKSDFLNNNFQIYPNDIIIVNQNSSRVKSAGLINNPSTFIGIISFLITTSLLVFNN